MIGVEEAAEEVEVALEVVFGDASEFAEPVAEETVAVLAVVDVRVPDVEVLGVVDREVGVDPVGGFDTVVDSVLVGAEDHRSIAVLGYCFVGALEVLTHQKAAAAGVSPDEGHNGRSVGVEGAASLFCAPGPGVRLSRFFSRQR